MSIDYFANHTGKSLETIASDIERDYFFTAEEAVSYGLADKIMHRS